MALNYEFPQRLNLDKYDVYLEQPLNDTSYIFIDKLPRILTYGKHFGTLSWRSLKGKPQLKHGSKILFELKDSNGNIIKTDLSNTPPVNGAAVFYVWVEQNPKIFTGDRYQLVDGPCKLTVVYELDNVPTKWKNRYNARSTFEFELQKNLPNTSPILFYSSSLVSSSFSISESIESDVGGTDAGPIDSYDRSVLHISTSNLTTEGGKVDFVEVSYNESRENTPDFKLLTTYPISSSGEFFEVSSSTAAGLNPLSHVQKVVTPKDIRRNGDVTFRIRFLNSNQEVARRLVDNSEITASTLLNVIGSPLLLETNDNLVHDSGGLFFGNKLTDGIKVKFDKGDAKEQSRLVFQKFKDGVFEKEVSRIEAERAEYVFGDTKDNKIKDSSGSAIIGGGRNKITSSVSSSVLSSTAASVFSSSFSNVALSKDSTIVFATQSSIVGGEFNQISGGLDNFIAGGLSHSMDKAGVGSIIGGINNSIAEYADLNLLARGFNTIVGGRSNRVGTGSFAYGNTIIGTTNASIGTNNKGGVSNLVAGGDQNHITGGANQVILGGQLNRIQSTTIGAQSNVIIGSTGITIPAGFSRIAVVGMSNFTRSSAECDNDTLYVTNTDIEQKLNVRGLLVTTGSVIVGEDLTVEGTLTAQEFHTEFTSASIIYESGSTQFGDTLDDTHDFSGSLNIVGSMTSSGDISGSATSTLTIGGALNAGNASFANVQMADLESVTNITASGNISSSGDIITSGQISSSTAITGNSLNGNGMFINGAGVLTFRNDDNTGVGISSPANSKLLFHQPDDTAVPLLEVEYTGINVTGEITASGDISSSGNVITSVIKQDSSTDTGKIDINRGDIQINAMNQSSQGLILDGGATGVGVTGNPRLDTDTFTRLNFYITGSEVFNITSASLDLTGHITASGNISASGKLFALGADFGDASIENVQNLSLDSLISDTNANTEINMGSTQMDFSVDGANPFILNQEKVTIDSDAASFEVKTNITASGNISSSGDIITSGNISGSVTGSFSVIEVGGGHFTSTSLAAGGGSFNNFTVTGDDSNTQTIADGNTLDIAGGTNITTAVGATDTVTINLDTSPSVTNITASGNISASGDLIATGDLNIDGKSHFEGNITASGDISASGNIIVGDGGHLLINNGDNIYFNDPDETFSISALRFAHDHGKLDFVAGGNVGSILQLWNSGSAGIGFRAMKVGINTPGSYANHTHTLTIGGDLTASGSLFKGDITASGNISASGIIGSSLNITGSSGHITASGNISASGNVISNEITASGLNLVGSGTAELEVDGNITASGNISASGTSHTFGGDITATSGSFSRLEGVEKIQDAGGELHFVSDDTKFIGDVVTFQTAADSEKFKIDTSTSPAEVSGDFQFINGVKFSSHITASGNLRVTGSITSNNDIAISGSVINTAGISGSGTISGFTSASIASGSFDGISIGNPSPPLGYPLVVEGGISASGTIYVGNVVATDLFVGGAQFTDVTTTFGHFAIGNSGQGSLNLKNITGSGDISGSLTKTGSFGSVHTAGNVGIGTTSPIKPLTVTGDISSSGLISAGHINFKTTGTTPTFMSSSGVMENTNFKLHIGDIADQGNSTQLIVDDENALILLNNSMAGGKVGINTPSPTQHLNVHGNILASGSGPGSARGDITASRNIKAGGDISSSGDLYLGKEQGAIYLNNGGHIFPFISQSNTPGSRTVNFGDNDNNDSTMHFVFRGAGSSKMFRFGDDYSDFLFTGAVLSSSGVVSSGDVKAAGNLSASGAYYGSASYFEFKNDTTGPSELRLHCEANSHYIGIRGPVHSGASSYVLKLPNTAPSDDQILKVNGSPSGGEVTLAWEDESGGGASFPITTTVSSSADLFIGKTDGAFVSASQGNIRLSGSGQGQIEVDRRLFDTGSATLLTAGGGMGDIVKFGNTSGLTAGDVYVLNAAGTWTQAQANATTTSTGSLGVPLGASAEGNGVLLKGMVKLDNDPACSIGAPVYLDDTTAGHARCDAPDTSNDVVRIIGHYYSGSGVIYFNPDNTFIEVA